MEQLTKIICIGLICVGVIYNITFLFLFDKKYPEAGKLSGIAEVVSNKTEKKRSNSYTVKMIRSTIAHTKGTKIIVYTDKSADWRCGDVIQLEGDFSKGDVARNYKGFNYRNYLKQSKIYGSMYVKKTKVVGHKNSLVEKILNFKMKLFAVLENIYTEQTAAFLKGILLR